MAGMRIRSIKPEFCTDEKIGELSREQRLHFVLLWMKCDALGVMEYKPRELQAQLYPYDRDLSEDQFSDLTSALLNKHLCSTFQHDNKQFLRVSNFTKHQRLTQWERVESNPLITANVLKKLLRSTDEVLPSESTESTEYLNPCSPHRGRGGDGDVDADFEAFWSEYPRKVGKLKALAAWRKSKKARPALGVVLERLSVLKSSEQWTRDASQYIPHPATWLNRGGWDDEVEEKSSDKKNAAGGYDPRKNRPEGI